MKVTVGKAYEGASDNFRLKDGTYEFQITDVSNTKGRVNMTLTTSSGKRVFKTFFLRDRDGKDSEKGMIELADFITTAMQIEDEEVEVDVASCVGFYLKCTVKNGSYEKDDEFGNPVVKKVYYINRPERCDGFSDGTPSFVEEATGAEEETDEDEDGYSGSETLEAEEDAFGKYLT